MGFPSWSVTTPKIPSSTWPKVMAKLARKISATETVSERTDFMSGFIWNVPQAISDLRLQIEIGDHEESEFTLRSIEEHGVTRINAEMHKARESPNANALSNVKSGPL